MPNESRNTMSSDQLLAHWQGHRRLTRRVIEAFPEDKLFTHSIGGMRPFGAMALEIITMGPPMIRGAVNGDWNTTWDRSAKPKAEILAMWDKATKDIDELWKQLPAGRFDETIKAFGQYEGKTSDLIMYVIDNEIHHRGEGYVYLRSLGIDPPPFPERG